MYLTHAGNLNSHASQLLGEKEGLEKTIKKFKEMSGEDDSIDLKQLMTDNAKQDDEIADLKKEVKKKETEVEAIKKQAKQQVSRALQLLCRQQVLMGFLCAGGCVPQAGRGQRETREEDPRLRRHDGRRGQEAELSCRRRRCAALGRGSRARALAGPA